jgi:hypothetical protein
MRSLPLAFLVLLGCATTTQRAVYTPAAAAPRVDLHEVASRHMACPPSGIVATRVAARAWQVSGCGQTREMALVDGARGPQWTWIAPIGARASNDMACPVSALVVNAPSPSERRVTGCEHDATYRLECGARTCDWTMQAHAGNWGTREGVVVTPPAPAGPVEPRVEEAVRGVLGTYREQVLACSGGVALPLRASWAHDGMVQLALDPPFAGTPVEDCVRQRVPEMQVATRRPGQLVHVVR